VMGAAYLGILLFAMGQRAEYTELLTHLFARKSEVAAGSQVGDWRAANAGAPAECEKRRKSSD